MHAKKKFLTAFLVAVTVWGGWLSPAQAAPLPRETFNDVDCRDLGPLEIVRYKSWGVDYPRNTQIHVKQTIALDGEVYVVRDDWPATSGSGGWNVGTREQSTFLEGDIALTTIITRASDEQYLGSAYDTCVLDFTKRNVDDRVGVEVEEEGQLEKRELSENSALNPDREWLPTEDCAQEAYYLAKSLSTAERAVVRFLLENQGVAASADLIASATANNETEMPRIVSRVNQWAEALGFVPVIASTEKGVTITAATAVPIAAGLVRADRQ